MAKEWAVESSEPCTHAKTGMQVPRKSVSSTLLELTVKAKRERKYRFRSLYREIDLRMLHDSFRLLKPKAAVGVDGVSWHEYEKDLNANLRDLLERLKTHRYRAKQIRRKYIPKASGKLRSLGIPSLEDKIVQMSARRLLEAIYEPDCSGSLRARSCRLRLGTRTTAWGIDPNGVHARLHRSCATNCSSGGCIGLSKPTSKASSTIWITIG